MGLESFDAESYAPYAERVADAKEKKEAVEQAQSGTALKDEDKKETFAK